MNSSAGMTVIKLAEPYAHVGLTVNAESNAKSANGERGV